MVVVEAQLLCPCVHVCRALYVQCVHCRMCIEPSGHDKSKSGPGSSLLRTLVGAECCTLDPLSVAFPIVSAASHADLQDLSRLSSASLAMFFRVPRSLFTLHLKAYVRVSLWMPAPTSTNVCGVCRQPGRWIQDEKKSVFDCLLVELAGPTDVPIQPKSIPILICSARHAYTTSVFLVLKTKAIPGMRL